MPASDYTSVSGGALRMKGAALGKPKKKKSKPKPDSEEGAKDRARDSRSASPERRRERDSVQDRRERSRSPGRARQEERRGDEKDRAQSNKTEAELRHEAQRRKRLDEKLKREGVKTHKEKVEDLNRYLSRLSEHHDMPKIGPG